MSEQILYIIIGVVIGGAVAWYFTRKPGRDSGEAIQEHFMDLQHLIADQLDRANKSIDRRLQENVRAMDESKIFLANRVSAAEQSVRSVSAGLGKLAQATSALQKTSDDIATFQQMLKSPKVRGSFGEILLDNLLSEMLPTGQYEKQYMFPSTGDVADAIIRLQDGQIVAIDAKFPLANYEAYANERDSEKKGRLRREFVRDVKKHIADISKKYIMPDGKTLDFAFMYVPIESVYYEVIMHDPKQEGLWEYAGKHHVVPVSPNSLYAYLQTVLIGLRGMQIEQQTREILQHLGQLRSDFERFAEDFATVGTHLTNAKNRYDDSTRRLDKFSNRLDQLETAPEVSAIPEEVEKEKERVRELT